VFTFETTKYSQAFLRHYRWTLSISVLFVESAILQGVKSRCSEGEGWGFGGWSAVLSNLHLWVKDLSPAAARSLSRRGKVFQPRLSPSAANMINGGLMQLLRRISIISINLSAYLSSCN